MDETRIVVVAWEAGPAVDSLCGEIIGGMETFAWRFARALAVEGHRRVTLVFRHDTWQNSRKIDGVALRPLLEPLRSVRRDVAQRVDRRPGFPWLRIRSWGASLFWQLPLLALARVVGSRASRQRNLEDHLRGLRPDVWVALGSSHESATVVRVARQLQTPVLLWLRSDADIDPRFYQSSDYVSDNGIAANDVRSAIEQATQILCQSETQRNRLRELTGRDGILIHNPIDAERWACEADARRDYVLWVGRYDRMLKRPELCLEVARRLPEIPFRMIVNRHDPDVEQTVRSAAPSNVTLIDYVPYDEMPAMFAGARLFAMTNSRDVEGFSNVLLESAAAGVPIAAYEDFDDFLARSQAGLCAEGDLDAMAEGIKKLWDDSEARDRYAQAGKDYVARDHTVEQAVARFDEVVRQLRAPASP